jgi:hypothetical protein
MQPKNSFCIEWIMTRKQQKGRGRLVPTLSAGVTYQVKYGIQLVPEVPQHGRGVRPAQWAKCSVQFEHAGRVPNGNYFLYTDEGRVHQLKFNDGKWQYLAVAA